MRAVLGTLFIVGLTTACKGSGPAAEKTPAAEPAPRPASSKDAPPKAAAPSEEPPEAPVKNELKAEATTADPPEGLPATFALSLRVLKDDTVRGRADVAGEAMQLQGALVENTLRLWATGPEGAKLTGGYFIGEMKDGKPSGTFALSGNGGVPAVHGTWK